MASARAALGRAAIAAGGTVLLVGGGTIAVGAVSMTVARVVIDRQKRKLMVKCGTCNGRKKTPCNVCLGERVLKYHPAKLPPVPAAKVSWCACAMCEGSGSQVCLNCLGEGEAYPFQGPTTQ